MCQRPAADYGTHTAGGAGTGTVSFDDGGSTGTGPEGSFTYQAIDAAANPSNTATVNIERTTSSTIAGTAGADIIFGYTGDDDLDGAGGNDTYAFRATGDGNDVITGDISGTDAIYIGTNGAAMTELNFRLHSDGDDLEISYNGAEVDIEDQYNGQPIEQITFVGGATYFGYNLSSSAYTLSTDNSSPIDGTSANNVLAGDDDENEVLNGGDGNDLLFGNDGNDTLNGGNGNDLLVGGGDNDTLQGGADNDTYVFALGDGNDTITDSSGSNDTLAVIGGSGNDTLNVTWSGSALTIPGITSHSGIETIALDLLGNGSVGDTLSYAGTGAANGVTVNLAAGTATGFNSIAGVENVTGGAGNDTLTGDTNANTLIGAAGIDVIDGGAGGDNITGGADADTMTGGLGADTFIIGPITDLAAGETINGTAEAGTIDTLRLDDAGAYNLTTFGITNINSLVLSENATGFNVTVGDAMVSTADFDGNGIGGDLQISSDTSMSSGNGVTINASGLTGANQIVVVGSNLGGNDTITGGAGNDTINSGSGNDTIIGGAGSDVIDSGAGNDTITMDVTGGNVDTLNAGADTDTLVLTGVVPGDGIVVANLGAADQIVSIGGVADALVQQGFENLDASGIGSSLNATGSAGDNTIIGSNGNDSIDGGGGNDTITGGAGVDTLTGGTGNDTFRYASTAEAAAGENIVEATSGGSADTIRTTATADLSALTVNGVADLEGAGADQGIEQILIQSGTTATFSGAQLTGNTIAINKSAAGTTNLVINVASGATNSFANLTFAAFTGGDAFDNGADTITINGGAGNETITATTFGDTINAGAGADTVKINAASLTSRSWTADLGSDAVQDTVIFNHAALGLTNQTVVTVDNFIVANDRIAVTLNGTSITATGVLTITADNTSFAGSERIVEISINNAARVTTSLTDDSDSGAIEDYHNSGDH